ncbi:hypothetical protein N9X53_06465 [Mariniblastus sp.]|nr:hypothetical protein [Mariniblastus sp.]
MVEDSKNEIDIDAEVDRFFDGDSRPQLVIICGGVCAGKTTLRRKRYSKGFVVLDAAEIFLSLSRGEYFEFPTAFEEPLEQIGQLVAINAAYERRNIVTEVIPMKVELDSIFDAMTKLGYNVEVVKLDCDPQVGWQRNVNRSDDNISAVFTETFHERWLIGAAEMLTSAEK